MSNADENELPQTYAVRLTEHAQRDVDLATLHFADTASAEVAVEWREGFYDELAVLATFPRRFPLAPEKFRGEVRQMPYRRTGSGTAHRVLFTIVGEEAISPDAPTVRILHVRHSAARPLTRMQIRAVEAGE